MPAAATAGESLAGIPHHDGSPLYLPNRPTAVGEEFDVLLRAPYQSGVTRVVVRQVHDGEPFPISAWVDHVDATGTTWWRARLTQHNPILRYRFLTDSGPLRYRWITAVGPVDHDPNDAGDFVSSIHAGGPEWLAGAVAYQIFPDRFARSGRVGAAPPDWAIPADWGDPPIWGKPGTARHFFGGDLYGVMEHLDHIEALGANLLYLTPVFPAPSNHRYNASSFAQVDPLLGGDEAYAALIDAAHDRGMRVLGDFTSNHTGDTHEWFRAARSDPESPERGYYHFGAAPDDYVGWFGLRSLPKVDHRSEALRQRMFAATDSPIRRYLRSPFNLDGWRIDVANMTGRYQDVDVNHEVARGIRAALLAERPDGYLVGEHFHDFRDDLPGDGWQGVMNYSGFTKPLWSWLAHSNLPLDNWMGLPWRGWPNLPGPAVVSSMRSFAAAPWQHLAASMTIIGSHDSPRIATVTDDPQRVVVAVAAMMAFPGVPMVWAGDEIGLQGLSGEDGRRSFPWHRPDSWNRATMAAYRDLIAVRAATAALRTGSLRWVHIADDCIVFLRETAAETVMVQLVRASGPVIALPTAALGLHDPAEYDTLYGSEPLSHAPGSIGLPGEGPAARIWRWRQGATG